MTISASCCISDDDSENISKDYSIGPPNVYYIENGSVTIVPFNDPEGEPDAFTKITLIIGDEQYSNTTDFYGKLTFEINAPVPKGDYVCKIDLDGDIKEITVNIEIRPK